MSSQSFIVIKPHQNWDKSRLVIKDAKTITFKSGSTDTTGEFKYLNDDGEEVNLYITPSKQFCYFNYSGPFGVKADADNTTGIQLAYPNTSLETVNNPTEKEAAWIQCLEDIRQASIEKAREEIAKYEKSKKKCPKDEKRNFKGHIPPNVSGSFKAAEEVFKEDQDDSAWDDFIKPMYSMQNIKDTKRPDPNKPRMMYVKALTKGEGQLLKMATPVYGPGDTIMTPHKLVGKGGQTKPVFHVANLYYGSHMKNPHGISVRIKLIEATFVPMAISGLAPCRILPTNKSTASVEEDHEYPIVSTKPTKKELEEENNDFKTENDEADKLEQVIKKKKKHHGKSMEKSSSLSSSSSKRHKKSKESE